MLRNLLKRPWILPSRQAASSRGAKVRWTTAKITVGSFLALAAGCQSYRISNDRRLTEMRVEGAGGEVAVPLVSGFSGLVGELEEKDKSKLEDEKGEGKEDVKEDPIEFAFCETLRAMGSGLLSNQQRISDDVAALDSQVDKMTSKVHSMRAQSAVVLSIGREKSRFH
jgi:hypothetical protein